MKLKVLMVPVLLTTALFAQTRGGFRPRGSSGGNATPPTAAQLATRELQTISAFLGLDTSQTSTLMGNTGLVSDLTTEETALETNRAALQKDISTLGTSIAGAPATPPTATVTDINSLNASSLQARVTAAGQVVTALASLGLNSTQQGKVPNLVNGLVNGGIGGGMGGIGGFRGPRAQ